MPVAHDSSRQHAATGAAAHSGPSAISTHEAGKGSPSQPFHDNGASPVHHAADTTDQRAGAGAGAGHHLLHYRDVAEDDGSSSISHALAPSMPASLVSKLYVSHFLSTWNSRLFEFGAAIFLTSVFPGTLRPVSIYSLVRNAGYVLFSQPLGTWINNGDRLRVIRTSIVGQRVPVAASCALLLVLDLKGPELGSARQNGIFGVVVLLAVVEKLASTLNTISVERDWVVVITEGNEVARREMNARMRRIDLFCKLMGPLAISLVAIASTEVAIYTTLGMNMLSVVVEYSFIGQVYKRSRGLQREATTSQSPAIATPPANLGRRARARASTKTIIAKHVNSILPVESLPFYLTHPAFLPSFALALLYFTVLSFSGQMITYLVSVGYTSWSVGVARVVSSIFEISATWVAPFLMKRIGIVRTGIWSLAWQIACLGGALGWYFSSFAGAGAGAGTSSVFAATGLAVGVALSRMGLWGYDLSAQNIIQDEVDEDHRGSFAAVEASFQNLFEMLSFVMTIAFPRPDQFRYPAIVSAAAVYVAGGLYACFLRKRRGHLFHAPACVCLKE